MRRFGWALVAVILVCVVSARAQILSPILNDKNHAAAPGYTGPVDAFPGATHFWGLQCADTALATGSTKVANIRRTSDVTFMDINCLSNGTFDQASAVTFCTSTTCFVKNV